MAALAACAHRSSSSRGSFASCAVAAAGILSRVVLGVMSLLCVRVYVCVDVTSHFVPYVFDVENARYRSLHNEYFGKNFAPAAGQKGALRAPG